MAVWTLKNNDWSELDYRIECLLHMLAPIITGLNTYHINWVPLTFCDGLMKE